MKNNIIIEPQRLFTTGSYDGTIEFWYDDPERGPVRVSEDVYCDRLNRFLSDDQIWTEVIAVN